MKKYLLLALSFLIILVTLSSCSNKNQKDQSQDSYAPCIDRNANQTLDDLQWIRRNALPITLNNLPDQGIVGGNFANEIQDVRIFGIGESVHGSHELYRFRIGLTEYLITSLNFHIVAVELPMPYVELLNDYIQGGAGELRDILKQTGSWVINTEEIAQFLAWAKDYNSRVDLNDRIVLVGYDIPINDTRVLIKKLEKFVQSIDSEVEIFENNQLSCIDKGYYEYSQISINEKKDCRKAIEAIKRYFVDNREHFCKKLSHDECELLLRNADMLLQLEEFYAAESDTSYPLRDQFMFDNLVWIEEILGYHEERIVVWGHNTHVGINTYGNTRTGTVGKFLHEEYADQYYVIGSSINKGNFNAIPLTAIHELGNPPNDSYEAFFMMTEIPSLFISFNNSTVPTWFSETHCLRNVGAYYNDLNPNEGWDMDKLSEEFDGFFYVENSTPTILLDP